MSEAADGVSSGDTPFTRGGATVIGGPDTSGGATYDPATRTWHRQPDVPVTDPGSY